MNETAQPRDLACAAHCRAARRLFATTGALGASGVDASAAVALTSLSGRLAWHAELCFELLPVRRDVDREALVAREVVGLDAVCDRLDEAAAARDAFGVLAALAEAVLPRLREAALEAGRVDPGVDGPRARAMAQVARDLDESIEALRALEGAPIQAAGLVAVCREELGAAGDGSGVLAPRSARRG